MSTKRDSPLSFEPSQFERNDSESQRRRDGNLLTALLRVAQPSEQRSGSCFTPAFIAPSLRPPIDRRVHSEAQSSRASSSSRRIHRSRLPTHAERKDERNGPHQLRQCCRILTRTSGEECFQLEFIPTLCEETEGASVGLWDENVSRDKGSFVLRN